MSVVVPVISTFDSRGISKAIRDFKKLEGGANRAGYVLRTMDAAAVKVAKSVMKIGGVAAVAGGFAAKSFIEFDDALNQSLAIMGDVSDGMKKDMSNAARQMAKETTFSATQAAQSYFFLASAGLDAEQSVAALPRVAKFAQAGMFDMALATDLLTDAQSALGMTIKGDAVANMNNMTRVADVLVKANTLANASVQQFAESLTNKAAAAARVVGKDIEEVVAVLAAFADQGVKGQDAGTQLSIVMRDLQTRALQNGAAFKAANVEVFDQNGKMNNLGKIVQQLEKRLSKMSDAQKKAELATLGFSDKSQAALLTLLGTGKAIETYERQLRNAGGTTDEIAKKQLESLKGQLILAKNAFMDLSIAAGEKMAPAIAGVTDVMKTFAQIVGEQGVGKGVTYLSGQIVGAITQMGFFGKAIVGLIAAFAALRIATVTYTATMGALKVITTVTDGAVKGLIVRLGAAKIAMMAAGGVVAILSAAAIVYAVYSKRKSDAIQATKDFKDALKLEGDAQDEALLALYKSNPAYRRHIDTLRTMNITLGETNDFIQYGQGPLNRLVDEWNKADGAVKGINPKLYKYAEALGISTEEGIGQIAMVRNMVIEMVKQRKETLETARSQSNLALAMGDTAKATLIMQRALGMDPTIKVTATQATDALTKAEQDLEKVMSELGGGGSTGGKGTVKNAQDSFKSYINALKGFGSDQKSYTKAIKDTTSAKKKLEDATNAVSVAQARYDLIVRGYGSGSDQAKAAQEALEQSQRDLIRSNFDSEKATFAVSDAEKALQKIRSSGTATAQEIREAEIALAEAQLSQTEQVYALRDANLAVEEAQRKVNEIINGATTDSQTYKTALEELNDAKAKEVEAADAVTEAIDREAEAKLRLADAERELRSARTGTSKQQRATAEKRTGITDVKGKRSEFLAMVNAQFGKKWKNIQSYIDAGKNATSRSERKQRFNEFAQKHGIPQMARGGIVSQPTFALIGEKAPEAVVPLDRLAGGGDTYIININSKIADETLPDLLVAELRKFNRRSGAINIQVA
jgi:TP901 family phage tail tape measure protein